MRIGFIAAWLVSGLSLLVPAQTERPVFRAGVELMQIDVSVLDGKRQPVQGLTAADFTVLENGVPRPIRAFTAVALPAPNPPGTAPWTTSVAPDVTTNDVGRQDGRLVIILMDRTIPLGQPTITANRIATATVEALGPHDLAAVVSTSGGVPQTFTADRTRLLNAINAKDWSTEISTDSQELLASLDPGLAVDPLSDGRCLCGLCVLDTVTHIADSLRGATARRKTLFFIGSSLIVQAAARDPKADVGCDRLLKDARVKMLDALARSSLTIHSLDPTGISNPSPVTRASAPLRAGRVAQVQQDEVNEFLGNQESLGILPQQTGGRRVINTNLPEAKVPEIFHESESYYVLGFEPTPGGGTRSLEVKAAAKGAHVYTQRRYVTPAAGAASTSAGPLSSASTSLEAALAGLLPVSGRSLALAVSSFALGSKTGASVAVAVDASAFARVGSDVGLDVAVLVLNRAGKPVASARRHAVLSTAAAAAERPGEAVIRTQLELPPGDYEIRVGIRDPEADATASVFSQIVVPAFGSAPLSLSDVVLEAAEPQAAARGAPLMTTHRQFARTESVRAYMQVYQALARTDALVPVTVRARVVDAAGRTVRDQSVTLAAAQFRDRRADCQMALPVERLGAGDYLMRLDATAGQESVARTVRFSVR